MARYTGPVCKLCRREGTKLYLKGERCYSDKCSVAKRAYAPGQHGQGRKKVTEYGIQLREKQKTKRIYGLLEKQFRAYFDKAERQKGIAGENLLQILERRLDNVVYRLGFAGSRNEARQIVRHTHIAVNGRRVNIPSFLVKPGDVVEIREDSRKVPRIKEIMEAAEQKVIPEWLSRDLEGHRGEILRLPIREEIDTPIEEHMIVELYSR